MRRRITRKALDVWFPTVVRYAGVTLLFYAALVDRGTNPALLPTAAGMILFKSVYGNGNGKHEEKPKPEPPEPAKEEA